MTTSAGAVVCINRSIILQVDHVTRHLIAPASSYLELAMIALTALLNPMTIEKSK
jgi:hypothetical protein